MKQTMVFAILALVAIVIVSSFGLQFMPSAPVEIPVSAVGHELYVCPMASASWDAVSSGLRPFARYITIGFFFVVMILMFNWGWALYQNLLSDSFKRESFSKPWAFTKMTFWAGVIILLAVMTPNHFRSVHINGAAGEYVLCERDTPGARAVLADAVRR